MKRGQSWAEYIIVLAVTIIIAGIAMYMAGAFMGNNRQFSERDSASYWLSADVGVTRYNVNSSSAQLLIKNNKNFKINVTNITSTGAGILIAPGGANNVVLEPGQSAQVTASGLTCLSGTYSLNLVITYADVNYGTKYTIYGEKPLVGQCTSSTTPPQCFPLCNSPNDPACNDGVACTADACTNPGACNAACAHTQITSCINNDGCCPTGCTSSSDNNCPPACGNNICETGETYSNCPGDCCLSACTATNDNTCHSNCINLPISNPCSNFKPACNTITSGTSVCSNSTGGTTPEYSPPNLYYTTSCCSGTPISCGSNSSCNHKTAWCFNSNTNCTADALISPCNFSCSNGVCGSSCASTCTSTCAACPPGQSCNATTGLCNPAAPTCQGCTFNGYCNSTCAGSSCATFDLACNNTAPSNQACSNSTGGTAGGPPYYSKVTCCSGTAQSCGTNSTITCPHTANWCNGATQNCSPDIINPCSISCSGAGVCGSCTPTCTTGACTGCGTNTTSCPSNYCNVNQPCTYPASPSCAIPCSTGSCTNCIACTSTCGADCGNGAYCSVGTCTGCTTNRGNCDLNPANGCEVNLSTSNSNCGSCGHVCSNPTPVCSNGVCVCNKNGVCDTGIGENYINCANDCCNADCTAKTSSSGGSDGVCHPKECTSCTYKSLTNCEGLRNGIDTACISSGMNSKYGTCCSGASQHTCSGSTKYCCNGPPAFCQSTSNCLG